MDTAIHEREAPQLVSIGFSGTIRSSKAPGRPHTCHCHLQNEIQWKCMPVSNAVDPERLT